MKTLIIQTSPTHTASTLLVNALYGLIPELNDKKIIGEWVENWQKKYETHFKDIIVLKSHVLNIDNLIKKYGKKYDLYFVCSERKERQYFINKKYKVYKRVIVFDFEELNESETNTVRKIVENIHNKINSVLNIELNIENGIKRVNAMNKRYEEIKEEPFTFIDDFYEIHGSHRNRKNKQ